MKDIIGATAEAKRGIEPTGSWEFGPKNTKRIFKLAVKLEVTENHGRIVSGR